MTNAIQHALSSSVITSDEGVSILADENAKVLASLSLGTADLMVFGNGNERSILVMTADGSAALIPADFFAKAR